MPTLALLSVPLLASPSNQLIFFNFIAIAVDSNQYVSLKNECLRIPEINLASVNDNGCFIKFNEEFACLGSIVDFLLDDTEYVKNRSNKASKSMGALNFRWDSQEVHY